MHTERHANPAIASRLTFTLAVPRAEQPSFSTEDDSQSDFTELFTALSCLDYNPSDVSPAEGASDTRIIDGSSRLYSNENSVYLLPLDEEEFQRLDKQDLLLRLGMWGLFPLRSDIEQVIGKASKSVEGSKTVLDVGCGAGQWALAMASAYPHVHIVGIDQAVQMPEEPIANVEFQRHNVNHGLKAYYGAFDIVHCRCIGSGITSYRALIEEATKCVKPGGLAIFIEGDFDLLKEDQQAIQEPASDANPSGSWLQKWMQAVREAQIRRCELTDADDSPETLDKGLWQFNAYNPATCGTASILTPTSPWPQSQVQEEALHFRVAGILMRQNLKLFVTATEQLLIEDGHSRDDVNEWATRIREEIAAEGRSRTWFRWRVAWGRTPSKAGYPISAEDLAASIASTSSKPIVLPLGRRQEVREQLRARVHQFFWKQCHIRNQHESLAYIDQRNNEPFSTRGRF